MVLYSICFCVFAVFGWIKTLRFKTLFTQANTASIYDVLGGTNDLYHHFSLKYGGISSLKKEGKNEEKTLNTFNLTKRAPLKSGLKTQVLLSSR